jgi:hypothetical protein
VGRRTIQMNFRTEKSFQEQLQTAAKKNGVSVNKEMNERLKHSFDRQTDLFEDQELFAIMQMVALAMQRTGAHAAFYASFSNDPQFWIDNAFGYDQAVQAAVRVLEAFRPAGDQSVPVPRVSNPDGIISDLMKRLGKATADWVLAEIKAGKAHFDSAQEMTERLKNNLGRLADRIDIQAVQSKQTTEEPRQ